MDCTIVASEFENHLGYKDYFQSTIPRNGIDILHQQLAL